MKFWTTEKLDELKELYLEKKYTMEQMAVILGASTRNVVSGKIYALGLAEKKKIEELPPLLEGVRLLDAGPNHCRWIIKPQVFCGRQTVCEGSWCQEHRSICIVPLSPYKGPKRPFW